MPVTVRGEGCDDCLADTTVRWGIHDGRPALILEVGHHPGCPNYNSGDPQRPKWLAAVIDGLGDE